jgi:ethanolamine-phosphate cytidylyltransferase
MKLLTVSTSVAAVEACRWVTKSVPHAPYVTTLPWISHYGCWYVVHGDDITSDANGEDCYRFVKQADRFLVVKRTPGISTTDLVGRMLLCTKSHFIRSLTDSIQGKSEPASGEQSGQRMLERIRSYATDQTGLNPGCEVWTWKSSLEAKLESDVADAGAFSKLVDGVGPKPGQRIIYVDGGFDLFSSGHIEFLKRVSEAEGGSAYVVAGVHDDHVINHWKGLNYPIMNIFERGLCVLQCKYVQAVVFGAPFSPSKPYLDAIPAGKIDAVYHGPTSFMPLTYDPYTDAKAMGLYREVGSHDFANVNAGEIVLRIMKGREAFEERQRRKGQKAVVENEARQKEILAAHQAAADGKNASID